jgi:hypothetical protein
MRVRSPLAVILIAGLLTTACSTPTTIPDDAATPSPTESVAPGAAMPEPATLLIGLDVIQVLTDDDSVVEEGTYSDGVGLIALLTNAFGAAPVTEFTGGTAYPVTAYRWGGGEVVVRIGGPYGDDTYSDAWLVVEVPEYAGLSIRNYNGITVGSARAEVLALAPYDPFYDSDGDGASDFLGIEQRSVPGVESLSRPGEPGSEFVEVDFEGDTVTAIRTPSSDYHDV